MDFDQETLEKIARLSMLNLPEGNTEKLNSQLGDISNLFSKIQSLDLQAVEPLSHPLELTQRLREDVPEAKSNPDIMQATAPATESGLYLVPQVIE